MEASDMKPTNCHFCNEPSPMFPLDGANLAICSGCLVETVQKALIFDVESSEEEQV